MGSFPLIIMMVYHWVCFLIALLLQFGVLPEEREIEIGVVSCFIFTSPFLFLTCTSRILFNKTEEIKPDKSFIALTFREIQDI